MARCSSTGKEKAEGFAAARERPPGLWIERWPMRWR